MGPYKFLFVPKDSNGFLWVLIVPHALLCVLMGPNASF